MRRWNMVSTATPTQRQLTDLILVASEDGDLKEVPQATAASRAEEDDDDAIDTVNKSEAIATEKADKGDGQQTAS